MRTLSSKAIFILCFFMQLLLGNTVIASTLTIDLNQVAQDGFTNIRFNYSHSDNTNTASIFDQGNSSLRITYSEIGSDGFLDTNINYDITGFLSTVASDQSVVKTTFTTNRFNSLFSSAYSIKSLIALSDYEDTAGLYLEDIGSFSFEVVRSNLPVILFNSGAGTKTTIDFTSGDVSAVPVPAAVWLMGSGILGLVGLSRKKKTS